MDSNETVFQRITDFIQNVGIPICFRQISEQSFVPGLLIENGILWIDKNQLKFIVDALHEAGQIALMTSEQRTNLSGALEGQNDAEAIEMAVIAWTYAACLEIGIEPSIVFHPDWYKGGSESILENFGNGQYFGVPILGWYGIIKRASNTQKTNTLAY